MLKNYQNFFFLKFAQINKNTKHEKTTLSIKCCCTYAYFLF